MEQTNFVPMRLNKKSRSTALILAISLGDWRYRLLLIFLSVFSITLMTLSHAQNPALHSARMAMTNLLAPAIGFLSEPTQSIGSLSDQWQQWQNIYDQNRQLREENAQLKQWQRLATELEVENASLRHLLNLAPVASSHFITGKMLGVLGGSFTRSQFLNIGSNEGVLKDMTVITGDGLVGRVMEVGDSTSRVMMVTDINSHIAVITEHGREQAVAVGNNNKLLELRYLPADTTIKPGEKVLTSGDAELMPAGIPVGEVVKVENDKVLVKPVVDWSRLSYVSLVAPQSRQP